MENAKNTYYEKLNNSMMSIINYYFISKGLIRRNGCSLASGETDYFNPYYLYIDRVNQSFMKLDMDEKELINNEFINPTSFNWWKKYYSKSNFLVFKTRAIKKFLRLFNEN